MSQSGKTGLKSDHQKQDNTRHGSDTAPETNPVPGAHGGWREEAHTAADGQDLLHDVPKGDTKRSSGNA